MITQQDLIDWIDRPPSNDDLDLATFISTRLEKFYDLEHQLQQKENIIKEVREYIKKNMKIVSKGQAEGTRLPVGTFMWNVDKILEILDKENK